MTVIIKTAADLPREVVEQFKASHAEVIDFMRANDSTTVLAHGTTELCQAYVLASCSCDEPACTGLMLGVADIVRGQAFIHPSRDQALELAAALTKWAAQ